MDGWWLDDPITAPGNDALGRGPFVRRVVATLQQVGTHPSSTVVALTGPWGSGKTSTANLVLAQLKTLGWGYAVLNPWAVGSAEAIVAELLAAVREGLPAKASKARRALGNLAEYAVPWLSLIPHVGGSLEKVGGLLQKRVRGEDSLQARLAEVRHELADLDRPHLVFVDDVDRLQPEQLLALFRAVRVLGRLPNVHYLVAYDQATVLDVLKATTVAKDRTDRALNFLEKIVTIRLAQPVIRPEQSSRLFTEGLTALLDDLRIGLTDEQRRRLGDEWEALFSVDLVEPRGIRRFLTQLRVYLPLVGPGEVDIVDFLVAAHLRSAYPGVYEALRADRMMLAAPPTQVDDERLVFWRDDPLDREFGLSPGQARRVRAAVHRLFPALRNNGERRRQGISDADYVARYFIFLPGGTDPTDAELRDGLHEWTTSRHVAPPAVLSPLLLPGAERPAPSAAVVRRLDALTEQLDDAACTALLPKVIALPSPAGHELVGGTIDALVQWFSHLLARASHIDEDRVFVHWTRQPIAASLPLLRALAIVADQPRSGPIESFGRHAAHRSYLRFRTNVLSGDSAPEEPLVTVFVLVEQLLGTETLNRLLCDDVDAGGFPIDAFAARLVEPVTDLSSGRAVIMKFDAEGFARRLGSTRLLKAVPLSIADVPAPQRGVWTERRLYTARQLQEVAGKLAAGRRHLPELSADVPQPFVNHHVEVLTATAGHPASLTVTVSTLVPAGRVIPAGANPAPGPYGRDREQIITDELARGALTGWLTEEAGAGRVEWRLDDAGDGRRYTRLSTRIAGRPGEDVPAIQAGAQIRTGSPEPAATPAEPYLVADLAVALWQRKLPLANLYSLCTAVLGQALRSSTALYGRLIGRPDPAPRTIARITLDAPAGIQEAVGLDRIERVGTNPSGSRQVAHFEFACPAADPEFDGRVAEQVIAVLHDWLMTSGYRGYEDRLRDLWSD